MLGFFPTPYPDELLYSVLARYRARACIISPKTTLQAFFRSKSATAILDFPCNLSALCRVLPVGASFSEEYFIFNHTLYPFYAPFVSKEQAKLTFQDMLGGDGRGIAMRMGIMASSVCSNSYLKFCPECYNYEVKEYGEPYWHRLHQIPGIFICPVHRTYLRDSLIALHGTNKHEFYPAGSTVCMQSALTDTINNESFEHLLLFAQDAEWLLSSINTPKGLAWYHHQYINLLIEKGFATINGRVRQEKLHDAFLSYYSVELLEQLQSNVSYMDKSNWLMSIVRKPRKSTHPLRHLLLLRFLQQPINIFFNDDFQSKPFGLGPWPCLNIIDENYKKNVINEVVISYDHKSKKPVGTFSCSCGFTYSRTGPDSCDADKLKIGRIKSFGQLWTGKLYELYSGKGLSLREIARRLNVNVNTVIHHIEQMGKTANKELGKQIERQRKAWSSLHQKYPDLSETQLRKIKPALYIWLYRHDSDWLKINSPKIQGRNRPTRYVDWEERDKVILAQVKNLVSEMLCSDSKPERISISKIGKKINKLSWLEKNLDKMPQSRDFLLTTREDTVQFQMRRILWAVDQLKKSGKLSEWRIYRLAGIRHGYSPDITSFISNILK